MELIRALYHWLRLGWYLPELRYLPIDHRDAPVILMRCLESQAIVDGFLNARPRA